MTIKQLQNKCFGHALSHGFLHKNMNIAEMLCEVHGEVSEALTALQSKRRADLRSYEKTFSDERFACYVKDSLEDELADIVMRVATLCGYLEIDLEKHIAYKIEFNKNRGYLHGKYQMPILS